MDKKWEGQLVSAWSERETEALYLNMHYGSDSAAAGSTTVYTEY